MRCLTALTIFVLAIGYAQCATIRDGREGDAEIAAEVKQPVLEEVKDVVVVSELRKEPQAAVETLEAVVEPKAEEAAPVETEEVVIPVLRNVVEPVVSVQDPVAIVLAEKNEEVKAAEPVVVAIVEPVAVRNAELETEVVSELKAVPIQAVEEVPEPVEAASVAEPEEIAPIVALKSVPVEEPAVVVQEVVAPEVVAIVEEPQPVVPATKSVVVIPEAQEEVAAVETEIKPEEVEPVEGTQRQNVVAEGETQRPTFFQQAQQVLTNNPITQFIQNNPLTNAIRGGTTSAPGAEDAAAAAAAPTTARPGLFAQLFNPSTAAPVANSAAEEAPTTAAPGFIQTAFSNIQNALPQPPNILANIQNIFSGNRTNATAPAAAAAAEPARKPESASIADSPSSNTIDQAKKKRLDENEPEQAVPAEEEGVAKPVALVATERLDAQVQNEQVVVAEEAVKPQEES